MSSPGRPTYEGHCFCGAVQIEATGAPFAMGYCHCADCRAWSAAPVNAFTLWSAGSVRIKAGEEQVATYKKMEKSHRRYCTRCGGHILTDHPEAGFTDVYSAVLPELEFKPEVHVYYGEKAVRIKDGLPKYRQLSGAFGGSGETLSE